MPIGQHIARCRLHASWRAVAVAWTVVLSLFAAPPLAGAQTANGSTQNDITKRVQREISIDLPSLHPLVQRILPAVVNISSELSEQAQADQPGDEGDQGDQGDTPFDQFLRRFFNNQMPQFHHEVMALGSGFIIDPSGYIVTNNHVIKDAHKITVILPDNSRHPAKVIGRDPKTDLALLKIDAGHKLPFVRWGDSSKVEVGDWVVAVGNPFGLGGTVTAGIVSALGRDINEGPYDNFIQLDAPINRGNSGGPTFNLEGQVIGINTAIYSPSGGSVGIGFAIPSNTAKDVIEQLKTRGYVTRGWLGVAIQSVTPTIARTLGIDPAHPHGALVASVNPGSPAAKAGIRQGDVILDAGGRPVKTVHDLPLIVADTPPGRKIDLNVLRGGQQETLLATVGEMPKNPQVAMVEGPPAPETASSLGLKLSSLTPQLRRQFGIPKDVEGVVVTNVANASSAGAIGIQPGDVIQSIDQKPARTARQAAQALKEASAKGNILLLLNRKGVSEFVGLSIGGNSPG
ncbi:MAG TPA: DegQ family serine endoprotease [Stellaceae bacterium]|nr:DegQ family serine endoprotease [Stellaceae bacterium]